MVKKKKTNFYWFINRKQKWVGRSKLVNRLLPPCTRLLDIGCCNGGALAKYSGKAESVFALDINLKNLKKFLIDGINIVNGNAINLPFKDLAFDSIVIAETLEHIENDKGALKEINRVLAPRGGFIITVPNQERFNLKLLNLLRIKQPIHPGHVREYTLKEIKRLVEGAGFEVNKISGDGLLSFGWLGELAPGLASSIIIKAQKERAIA